jgi:rod shape-determining protein MreC
VFSLFQRYREPLLLAALLLYPLLSFLSSGHRGREPNALDRVLLAIAAPIQNGLTSVFSVSGSGVEGYVALRGAHEEALACRVGLAQAQAEVNVLKEFRAENERLRQLLGYAEASVGPEVAARVVGLNPSPQFLSLRIDRGLEHGVRVGMPVVTALGVVGQIVRAVDISGDVMLMTDPASRIGAVVQRSRVRASIIGGGEGRPVSVEYVRREDDVVPGDVLVTAGTDNVFPAGLVLGIVDGVTRPGSSMFLQATLIPAVDLRRVEEALVVPLTVAEGSR